MYSENVEFLITSPSATTSLSRSLPPPEPGKLSTSQRSLKRPRLKLPWPAAGIFHREEVPIEAVKKHMRERGIETR